MTMTTLTSMTCVRIGAGVVGYLAAMVAAFASIPPHDPRDNYIYRLLATFWPALVLFGWCLMLRDFILDFVRALGWLARWIGGGR